MKTEIRSLEIYKVIRGYEIFIHQRILGRAETDEIICVDTEQKLYEEISKLLRELKQFD